MSLCNTLSTNSRASWCVMREGERSSWMVHWRQHDTQNRSWRALEGVDKIAAGSPSRFYEALPSACGVSKQLGISEPTCRQSADDHRQSARDHRPSAPLNAERTHQMCSFAPELQSGHSSCPLSPNTTLPPRRTLRPQTPLSPCPRQSPKICLH